MKTKPPKGWRKYRDEWVCPHGVGHPIPGERHHAGGIHGCCGCCADVTNTDESGAPK